MNIKFAILITKCDLMLNIIQTSKITIIYQPSMCDLDLDYF